MQKNSAHFFSTQSVEKLLILHTGAVEKKVLGHLRKSGFST